MLHSPYVLSFLLPDTMLLRVPEGRHCPCLHGIVLNVRLGLVTMQGLSRESLFEQTRRLFRVHAKGLPALRLAATLTEPLEHGGAHEVLTLRYDRDVTFRPAALRVVEPQARAG